MKEHHRYTRFGHPDKSAVAERSFKHHLIKLQDTRILPTVPGYINRRIGEAIDLELHLNNMKTGWPPLERVIETSLSSPYKK